MGIFNKVVRTNGLRKVCICVAVFFFFTFAILSLERRFDLKILFNKPDGLKTRAPDIVYSPCRHIPAAPEVLGTWPEELYLNYTDIEDLLDLPDPSRSTVELNGNGRLTIGAHVYVTITLFDHHGRKRRKGGDVVRAWLAEPSLGAAASARVVDNNDGTYRAQFVVFWEGRPEVRAAIIMPREAVSTAYKRRYTCPPVEVNTAVFIHPRDLSIAEETPCNFYPYISGYDVICNLTDDNFRRPWYCGKPRNTKLLCSDWTLSSERNLWQLNTEQKHMTSTQLELISLSNNALPLKTGIFLNVTSDSASHQFKTDLKCDLRALESARKTSTADGYLYEKKWYNKICRSQFSFVQLTKYLNNVKMVLIGDSTSRQFFYEMQNLVTCEFTTDTWDLAGKHHEVRCENETLKFSLTWKPHGLPFCTTNTPHQYFRPLSVHLNEYGEADKLLLVLHGAAHFYNFHSHVFYEYVKEMKSTVEAVLKSHPRSFIVIKGPNAFSFSKSTDHFIWMPDSYAAVYEKFVRDVFSDLQSDRVMFLDMMDITVATEQWHIHSEKFIIHEKLSEIFAFYSTFSETLS
ncbi:NXPE family member 1-like isoform X1 [Dreissena polymorpha]|uniref:NXPE C-terminal domain-containing protein n=1 Tax=Dreissena polymorpha TaxID=45954 RepID=A0A9D4LGK5_DREPO|nr:NXPE family member 1-like isoform X1 [Dreissena polymorpha]KAH3858188.1 hypothetical protein DPMN_100808 [Dreissena polymorpha]